MSIERLELVHIKGELRSLDDALQVCCESGCFHIVSPPADKRPSKTGSRQPNENSGNLPALEELLTLRELMSSKRDAQSGIYMPIESFESDGITGCHNLIAYNGIVSDDLISGLASLCTEQSLVAVSPQGNNRNSVLLALTPLAESELSAEAVKLGLVRQSAEEPQSEDGFTHLQEENPYKSPLKRTEQLILSLSPHSAKYGQLPDSDSLPKSQKDVNDYLDKTERDSSKLLEQLKIKRQALADYTQALTQLGHLQELNIDFSELFNCKHICVRIGKLPVDNLVKLERYNSSPFIFSYYDQDSNYYWGIYWTPRAVSQDIDEIFSALSFERIRIPDFLRGTPQEGMAMLNDGVVKSKADIDVLESKLQKLSQTEMPVLQSLKASQGTGFGTFELRQNALIRGDSFKITGFIPKADRPHFEELFSEHEELRLEFEAADSDKRFSPPIKLKNGFFSRPFAMFVEMYGLPHYDGINPTPFVAFIYTLLFGIMFGDLGQGIALSVIGFIIAKKTGSELGRIMSRIGISSALFGLVYGSVFGYEHALDPLYQSIGFKEKPFDVMVNTMTILIGAIAIGVVIILFSMLLNLVSSIKRRDFSSAIFSNNGIAGIVFYGALLYALISSFVLDKNVFTTPYVLCLIIAPLLFMFFREPLGMLLSHTKSKEKVNVVDFIASNFFEVFEFLLGYATNTLSFVRIGGFVLAHAGMMSVVMLLSEGFSASGSIVVAVIGNIFVMCVEGLLVGIQVLRLQFYEFFSRFYESGGEPFTPVNLKIASMNEIA